jgi:hypothetical protein
MRGGAFALGLTADAASVLSLFGPVAAVALLEEPESRKMIEGPQKQYMIEDKSDHLDEEE